MDGLGGWNRGMRRVSRSLLCSRPLPPGPVLDLGCGSGIFAQELAEQVGLGPVVGVDLLPAALEGAQLHAPTVHLAQVHLQELPFADGTFGVVTALDVLDQRGVDVENALAEAARVLLPGGVLLLRVSAHSWLTGPHDLAFNTARRYGRSDIERLLANMGFHLERVTYANSLLAPAITAVRLLQRWRVLPLEKAVYHEPLTNLGLDCALSVEAQWLRYGDLPFGISLYVMATRAI